MDNKTMLAWAVIGLGLIGLILWSRTPVPSTSAGSENNGVVNTGGFLTAEEKFYDFGTISMKNGKVDYVFKVANETNSDISLASVQTSCMCTVAYIIGANGQKGPFGMVGHGGYVPPANELIKAGETRDIKVVFDPNAHGPAGVGPIERVIYLQDRNGQSLELGFRANVTP